MSKRIWEHDHALLSTTLVPSESDRWKRIRYNFEDVNDIKALYHQIIQQVQRNIVTKTIIEILLNLKCCARCILRFLNVKDYKTYCASEKIRAHNYIIKDFNLAITLPSGLLVKEHSVEVFIKEKLREKNIEVAFSLVTNLKDAFKCLLGWSIEKQLELEYRTESPFKITVEYFHEESQKNHTFLTKIPSAEFNIKKKRVKGKFFTSGDSRQNIYNSLKKISNDEFIKYCDEHPPKTIQHKWQIKSIILEHNPVYVGGRYLKLSREMSQTPWIINDVRLAETSVSECIGELLREKFMCDSYIFVASGREDADVRMLGTGRPFYLEIINPRKSLLSPEELLSSQSEINEMKKDLIQKSSLIWVSKQITPELISQLNHYNDTSFTIEQQTPIRVLQSYIKEFIHGDLGRTKPSLGDILDCTVDIFELDVLEVDLQWPSNN
ncbi:19683_t:CDS:10 [Entrophospora sp. SA101]|nr:19683_t:CDS:10 [Entrophospora sp. SA101]CAJ0839079.1 12827_t:CDS:10 [Entrophospora sp. SA101]CAJ0842324.1 15276_t:CDS:10 [Entrophospora sp. SA101]